MPRLIAFLLAGAASVAAAQDYPTKPIIIVVPAAAGGPTDTLTRVLASSMGNAMKAQLIIENARGAGGIIGINKAAKARPDGYTLLLYHIGMSTVPALYRKLPYDTLADFDYLRDARRADGRARQAARRAPGGGSGSGVQGEARRARRRAGAARQGDARGARQSAEERDRQVDADHPQERRVRGLGANPLGLRGPSARG